jgi:hypothetical protein
MNGHRQDLPARGHGARWCLRGSIQEVWSKSRLFLYVVQGVGLTPMSLEKLCSNQQEARHAA